MRTKKPASIAVIPDGNRRYAEKHSLSIQAAYARGFEKAREVIKWSAGVPSFTFWALSLDNLVKRSALEKKILFHEMRRHIDEVLETRELSKEGIRVRFFGRLELLPKRLQEKIRRIEEETQENQARIVSIGIAYGGRAELVNAARNLALDLKTGKIREKEISEEFFEKYLWFRESPDLVIRTGAVQRLSGFLPWQTEYSELFFSRKLWPEFERADYDAAIEFFKNTQARYGR